MIRHAVLTLDGTAQQLSAMLTPNLPAKDVGQPGLIQIWIQPGGTNANPVFIGGPGVTTTDYGVRLNAAAAGVPPAPFSLCDHLPHPKFVTLADVYVIGTGAETVTVLWIPYI